MVTWSESAEPLNYGQITGISNGRKANGREIEFQFMSVYDINFGTHFFRKEYVKEQKQCHCKQKDVSFIKRKQIDTP